MDSRTARDGRTIEEVGFYHPIEEEGRQVKIEEERVRSWLDKGAVPSATVKRILNKNNITLKQG
jgi:small subunit ribosomal protein S16